MFGAAQERPGPKGTVFLVALFALVFLGAMASSIPSAPIEVMAGEGRHGRLVGHSRVSEGLAEQLAVEGYSLLAVDVTTAPADPDALWRGHVEAVAKRRFPVWGWLDRTRGKTDPDSLLRSLPLAGLFLYGPGAVEEAERLSWGHGDVEILPVLRKGDARPEDAACGVLMDLETFLDRADEGVFAVLIADSLTEEQIASARAAAGKGNCLVARVAILDSE